MGVHIADVTHFLLPDTAMDAEAALRGTTVYLVQVRRGTTVYLTASFRWMFVWEGWRYFDAA